MPIFTGFIAGLVASALMTYSIVNVVEANVATYCEATYKTTLEAKACKTTLRGITKRTWTMED